MSGFRSMPVRQRWLLLLFILLGFGLRIHDLPGQSLWSDEGLSLYRAQQTPPDILANTIVVDGVSTQDNSPPFYFLLLGGWRTLVGEGIFGLRYLNAVLALLALPAIYLAGRYAFGRPAGLIALFLLALSPFHVWQSQIIRNYGLLISLNLLSIVGMLRLIFPRPRPRSRHQPDGQTGIKTKRFGAGAGANLALWLSAGLLGIYTHYFGLFIFVFSGAVLLLTRLRRQPVAYQLPTDGVQRQLEGFRYPAPPFWRQRWFGAGLGVALLLAAPALLFAWGRFRAGPQIDFYPVSFSWVTNLALGNFGVGYSPMPQAWPRLLPALLLVGLGIWFGRRRPATGVILAYLLLPLGLILLLSLATPLYNGPRHLLIGLPPYLMLAAAGLTRLGQDRPPAVFASAFLLGLLLLLNQGQWLDVQFNGAQLRRDDIRGVANYLNQAATADDVIVLHDTLIQFTFNYYYHGAAPVISVPTYDVLRLRESQPILAALGADHDRVWFLAEPGPRNGANRWRLVNYAVENWSWVADQRFASLWLEVQLLTFVPEPAGRPLPATATAAAVTWPDGPGLAGYELPRAATAAADWWPVLYWTRAVPLADSIRLSLRWQDASGNIWAQWDRPLPELALAEAEWPAGTLLRQDQRLTIPAGLPPGEYQVWLRLVDGRTSQTIPTGDGALEQPLAVVSVTAAGCDAPTATWPSATRPMVRMGSELLFAGYRQEALDYRPGHLLELGLFWCVRRGPTQEYRWRLQLLAEDGRIYSETIGPLATTDFPATAWPRDALIMTPVSLIIPAALPGGSYELQLALLPASGTTPLAIGWPWGDRTVALDPVAVIAWPFVTEPPAVTTRAEADFGAPPLLALYGYDGPPAAMAPGAAVPVTLVWQALSDEIETNYIIFVHLTDAAGTIVGQGDSPPVYGIRPTSGWRAGEIIVDEHTFTLSPALPPGSYDLWVGYYDPATGRRLPVFVDDIAQPDDRLWLGVTNVGGAPGAP